MNFIKTALKVTIGISVVAGVLGGLETGVKTAMCFSGIFLFVGGMFG